MVKKRQASEGTAALHVAREWIGARVGAPFFVGDKGKPYRVDVALWVELPSGLVIATEIVPEGKSCEVLATLLTRAISEPMAGPARLPDHVRVPTPADEELLRGVLPAHIPVRVAPTPEIDSIVEEMASSMPTSKDSPTYTDTDYIAPASVETLFAAAKSLYEAAPWDRIGDDQVVRIDIPDLGVEGACLSVIGERHEVIGLSIFPSRDAFDSFVEALSDPGRAKENRDYGSSWLMLNFEPMASLPASTQRKVRWGKWPLASDEAVPCLERRDRRGIPEVVDERDVVIAAACAASLAEFVEDIHEELGFEDPEPASISYAAADLPEVRFTFPYDAFELFTPPAHNEEGHTWILTVDTFEFAEAAQEDLEKRLLATDGVYDADDPDDEVVEDGSSFVLLRMMPDNPEESRLVYVGRIEVSGGVLEILADSVEHADEARARIEGSLGDVLRHKERCFPETGAEEEEEE